MRLMTSSQVGPINLGNPAEFSIAELAEKVIQLTGTRSKLVRQPLPVDDPKQRCPDIGKAKSLLGFTPKISLEQGLPPTLDHFKRVLGA